MALCTLLMPNISYSAADGPLDMHLPLMFVYLRVPKGALKISGDA